METREALVTERLYENDVVYKFCHTPTGLTISLGKVQFDAARASPHIEWLQGQTGKESLEDAIKHGKIFIFNREVHVGNIAIVRELGQSGFVSKTKNKMVCLVEKKTAKGEKKQYILPSVSPDHLRKFVPFKIGDHILSHGWIGKVTEVQMKTQWDFGNSESLTASLPLHVVEELELENGMKVEQIDEKVYSNKENVWKTLSHSRIGTNRFRYKPATLTELAPFTLEVCWIQPFGPCYAPPGGLMEPGKTVKITESVKRFHFCRDDWDYYVKGGCFQKVWTREDHDNLLTYEQWKTQMLIGSTDLLFGEDLSPKQTKKETLFDDGSTVFLTPIALQTEVVVIIPNGTSVITHKMKACDIPELGQEVLPRPRVPPTPPIQLKNMDMVKDGFDLYSKYGFVLDPCGRGTNRDDEVLVKWIYDLGGYDHKETTEWVSKHELVLHCFQREFNPKTQRKIVVIGNEKIGTFKGITYPGCKAVIRLVGTFEDEEFWPHQLQFLTKMAVYNEEKQEWTVEQCPADY